MQDNPMAEQWRCTHCGEPVGAYEPMVTVNGRHARLTSRTREIRASLPAGKPYHRACYMLEHGELPGEREGQ